MLGSDTEDLAPVIERNSLKIGTFIDLATSKKTRADFTVAATCGLDKLQNFYILEILRGRWEWPDAYEYIVAELLNQGVRMAGVETNGFQLSSFQELVRDERVSHIAFFAVPSEADKLSRSLLVSARGAARKLYYTKGASWGETLISEFVNFPGGKHDDIVDAVCGCLELLNRFQVEEPTRRPSGLKKKSRWGGRRSGI